MAGKIFNRGGICQIHTGTQRVGGMLGGRIIFAHGIECRIDAAGCDNYRAREEKGLSVVIIPDPNAFAVILTNAQGEKLMMAQPVDNSRGFIFAAFIYECRHQHLAGTAMRKSSALLFLSAEIPLDDPSLPAAERCAKVYEP